MTDLKQCVKQILINKQHRAYEKEVRVRNLNYDRWIREKEAALKVEESFSSQKAKSLTNDFLTGVFESKENNNEGNPSKYDEFCLKYEIEGQKIVFILPKIFLIPGGTDFVGNLSADVILLALYDGKISEIALELILQKFKENENLILIYGDEDVRRKNTGKENGTQEEERTDPWFKPDWSPDRFLSGYYFGGLVAVRAKAFQEALTCLAEAGTAEESEE